jgi:hypothetical protein
MSPTWKPQSEVGDHRGIPKRNVEPSWKYGSEPPDTSGESEFSSIEPQRQSVYLRKKFQFNGGRGHFGGFKSG